MVKKKRVTKTRAGRLVITLIILLVNVIMLYPIINVVSVSFSSYGEYLKNPGMVLPSDFSLETYRQVLKYPLLGSGYLTTIIVTVVGTFFGICLTILTAYSLSKKELAGRKVIMGFVLFTMFFNGGMVPNFLLIRELGLYDSLWALILPACLTAYNVILMRNFFQSLPQSLFEAAEIDGANEPTILFRIAIPLSKPIIATILLFVAVGYWNGYMNGVIYIKSQQKWPLQLVLRELIMSATSLSQMAQGNLAEGAASAVSPVMLLYAAIVVAMIPILCVYPFLQKYFAKGVMIGAVKG